jgi:hypothetical protein
MELKEKASSNSNFPPPSSFFISVIHHPIINVLHLHPIDRTVTIDSKEME